MDLAEEETVNLEEQKSAPVYEALERFRKNGSCHLTCPDIKEAEETRSW